MRILAGSMSFLLCVALGCGDDGDGTGPGGAGADADPGDDLDAAVDPGLPDADPSCPSELTLERVTVATGLARPVFLTAPEGDDRRFVLEQHAGTIRILDAAGEVLETPFLDLDAVAGGEGGALDERGLLGLAFHPDYADNGRFFVAYTEDGSDDVLVAEYGVSDADPDLADPVQVGELLRVDTPTEQHFAGTIGFGPDGYLYVGLGDGSTNGDPNGFGQDPSNLLAAMLRLDVGTGPDSYGIPDDNPFVGDLAARDEIWAYGLRVPWRWSFDRATGDLFIGDVGEATFEEINVGAAGANYGWSVVTGTDDCYNASSCDTAGFTAPIVEFEQEGGVGAIVGGYVYRGADIPCLAGTYFYTDWATGKVRSFVYAGGQAAAEREWDSLAGSGNDAYVSFGEDGQGELYLVSLDGTIYQIVEAE